MNGDELNPDGTPPVTTSGERLPTGPILRAVRVVSGQQGALT